MAYTKINWQNSPSAETPINADNLNHMDDQIAENEQKISELETEVDDLGDGKVSKSGDTMRGRLTIDQQSGNSGLWLGNDIVQGNEGASRGLILLYGRNQYFGQIYDGNGLTGNRDYYLPDKSGTLALTSDIPTEETIDLSTYITSEWSLNSGGYLKAYRIGKMVTINGNGLSCNTANSYLAINIPNSIRPSVAPIAIAQNYTDKNSEWEVAIVNDGKNIAIADIGFYHWAKVNCDYGFSICYFV